MQRMYLIYFISINVAINYFNLIYKHKHCYQIISNIWEPIGFELSKLLHLTRMFQLIF